jgi:hypothetical protein
MRWALALAGLLVLAACGETRANREARQLARFPKGEIVEDGESPREEDPRGLPYCLRLLAPVLGRGVEIALDEARPDGAHDSPRWGVWTYEYVRAPQERRADGLILTHFGDIGSTSLGLEAQGEYARDVLLGPWRFWYPNGRLRAEGGFADGKLIGEWSFWNADGSADPTLSGVYVGGVRVSGKRP